MLNNLNKIIWAVATTYIMITCIKFTFRLNFIQFDFKKMILCLFSKDSFNGKTKPINTFFLTLAARIGVGSIAGVSLAIYLGGKGTIFWMWIITFFLAILSYCETILGLKYRRKEELVNIGGPSYYIEFGLKKEWLGKLYCILMILSCIFGFIGIQANTITKSISTLIKINNSYVGFIICIIVALIIFRGMNYIINFISKIIPIILIFYFFITIIIVFVNIKDIPFVVIEIVEEAFSIRPFLTGFIPTLITGIQRGIFSNEAGLGTCSISSASVDSELIENQGYIQMLGVYITTLIICTLTAFVVLTSDYNFFYNSDLNGIELTQYAFHFHYKKIGDIFVFIIVIVFSLSTILSCYYDGEVCVKYLFKNNKSIKNKIYLLRITTLFIIFVGCVISSFKIWNIVDILIAIIAVINIYAINKLEKEIKI